MNGSLNHMASGLSEPQKQCLDSSIWSTRDGGSVKGTVCIPHTGALLGLEISLFPLTTDQEASYRAKPKRSHVVSKGGGHQQPASGVQQRSPPKNLSSRISILEERKEPAG